MQTGITYEYVVKPSNVRRRLCAIIGYFVTFFALLVMLRVLRVALIECLIISAVLVLCECLFTWKYTSVEYEYSLTEGLLTLSCVYSGRARRLVAEITVAQMSAIMPYEGEYIERARRYAPERSIDFTADLQAPSVYCALYEREDDRRGILYFEATSRMLSIMRYYNHGTVLKALPDEKERDNGE